MKKFNVTLQLIVNPSRDIELETPETTKYQKTVNAETEKEAIEKVKNECPLKMSVWDSYADEDY